jgi:hypothetical protein
MQNFKSYLDCLSAFYNNLANWAYCKNTGAENIGEQVKKLQSSARLLREEIKKLPPDMVRPQVVEHIEKALSL